MTRTIHAKSHDGMNSFLKALGVLRRKTFVVTDATLKSDHDVFSLTFVIEDLPTKSAETASKHLCQMYDLYEVHLV